MDSAARTRRSPPADRFLGLFTSPTPSLPTSPIAGDELLEGDLLFPPAASSSDPPPSPDASGKPGRVPGGHVGLLAALHEGDRRLPGRGGAGAAAVATAGAAGALLRRKATIAAAEAAASSAQNQSPPSAARAIPSVPRTREQHPGVPYHQSAPVKVPVRPPPPRRSGWDHLAGIPGDGYDDEEDLLRGDAAMLPPHEMVARASAGGFGAPVKPSSMLEGVGRTLKGRDLRRVRDAVLRQTGFLD
ncbi:hypothetical protein E2562_017973 [Oryza meyeriana var. granulata]|uniref:Senescence regulator n=1 Tax=Oryza meyeriana var. granulata TaxID=110450 RepID=A0A6G1F919_9ORYZ|nr:hypothetical protein E2562_017973 [Oryza meyeriana var. granulata]